MTAAGNYTFTPRDAISTVEIAHVLLDLYPEAAQRELDQLRSEVDDTVASGDPESVVGALFAQLLSARDAAQRAGTLPEQTTGTVEQLNVSGGGVPKTPVESVEVDFRGITSDKQNNRVHHGRPFQALCLWSAEIIDDLAAQGHPIAAGNAGENITTRGIEWTSLTMGTHLRIGDVLAQISAMAVPCGHQAQWFTDRDYSRLHAENGDISRLYATIIEPGIITTGDAIVVEAASQQLVETSTMTPA